MSTTMPITQPDIQRALPTRVAIARYFDLRRAEEVADRLVHQRVPESSIQINATGLRPGLAPTSSSNYWDAALNGIRVGAIFGAVFAGIWSLTGLADGSAGIVGVLFGALIGGTFGATVGVIGHWGESGPRRGEALLEADEFHILVDERYEELARRALRPGNRHDNGRFSRGAP